MNKKEEEEEEEEEKRSVLKPHYFPLVYLMVQQTIVPAVFNFSLIFDLVSTRISFVRYSPFLQTCPFAAECAPDLVESIN
jgi:hypothetical protein